MCVCACAYVCQRVCVPVYVCAFVSVGLCAEEKGGGTEVARVVVQMSHSQRSLMNGSCCDGDGEMRRRPGLRTPVI